MLNIPEALDVKRFKNREWRNFDPLFGSVFIKIDFNSNLKINRKVLDAPTVCQKGFQQYFGPNVFHCKN